MAILRSPDTFGHAGKGRYLLVVNSGYGVQFSAATNEAQQSIAVIDLNATPEPVVIQNVYFPTPQSANAGLAFFSPPLERTESLNCTFRADSKIKFGFFALIQKPPRRCSRVRPGQTRECKRPSFEISKPGESFTGRLQQRKSGTLPYGAGNNTGRKYAGDGQQPGGQHDDRARSPRRAAEGESGFAPSWKAQRKHLPLRRSGAGQRQECTCVRFLAGMILRWRLFRWTARAFVRTFIGVDRHPTAMMANAEGARLFVANSDADSVSVIDTATDQEIERN